MAELTFDSVGTAIVVIDMQNGFCHPDGSLYAPKSEAVIEPIKSVTERAHAADIPVVYTRDVHPPEQFEGAHYYDEFDRWGEHVVEGSWESELVAELEPHPDDHIVEKHTYDAFYQTELHGWLQAHGVKDLLICGTLANVCVLHTAGSAGLRDYQPVLLSDAIGAIESAHHEYALDHAGWLFGEVTETDAVEFRARN